MGLVKQRKAKISVSLMISLLLIFISNIFNSEPIKQYIIPTTYYVVAIAFVAYMPFHKWKEAYVGVMSVIAGASLILYGIEMINPALLSVLPITKNALGVTAYNAFLALSARDGRNMGLFWEPGAYQTYLNIAILLELFQMSTQRRKKWRLVVLLGALVTTFSTGGYLTLLFVIVTFLCECIANKRVKRPVGVVLVSLIMCAVAAYYIITIYNPQLYYTLFGKLESFSQTGDLDTSVGTRYVSVITPIALWLTNPLFGKGYIGLTGYFENIYGHTMATCTPTNWFGMYGLGFGVIMLAGMYGFTKAFSTKKVTRFFALAALLVAMSSENYVNNPSLVILIAYGLLEMRFDRKLVIHG